MKKFASILIVFMIFISAYADSKYSPELLLPFKKYQSYEMYSSDYPAYLKRLEGDTIFLEFSPTANLRCFKVAEPDTVWIKKRPKKNPELGKHYVLNDVYKGVWNGREYVTPAAAVNGKPFAIYNVTSFGTSSSTCFIQLLDLESLELVKFSLYERFPEDFSFTTAKTQRIIKEYMGQKMYYCPNLPDYPSSSTKVTECTYLNGDFDFVVSKSKGMYSNYTFQPNATIRVECVDGSIESFSPLYPLSLLGRKPVILSKNEYESLFVPKTINSETDFSVLDENPQFPFSFIAIVGTSEARSPLYQELDPMAIFNTSALTLVPRSVMCIGERFAFKGEDYYKACFNGKAFFIKSKQVKLSIDETAKLDSLMNCPQELRDKFFRQELILNQSVYYDELEEHIKQIQAYSKYGLAIPRWGVYDMSEYTDGTGINFSFYNPTAKSIKYITVNFQGYNAVDDPVGGSISKRCIGPIEPDETASYDFEYAWMTDVVEYAKIKSILVQYKDGTSKNISNPKLIMFTSELLDFITRPDVLNTLK